MEQLSEHDKSILDIIFDPLQLMSSGQNSDEPEDEITGTFSRFFVVIICSFFIFVMVSLSENLMPF